MPHPLPPTQPPPPSRRRVPTRLLGAAVALALLAGLAACSGTSNNASAGAALPNGTGAPLSTLSSADAPVRTSLTAVPKAEGPVNIYAQPGDTTPKSTQDNPWLYDNQPGAEVPLVFMVKQESGDSYEVFLATRPNGSTGFVKKADMDVEQNPYRIEVDSAAFRLKAYKGNEVILDAPIAVGMADAPTPGGEFYLNVLLTPPDPGGDYGPFAYGLSGHSEVLDTFNGGDGQLGIHGTNHPELLGTSVSHGCIRLRNEDITKLAEEVKLPLGTPVKILS